MIRILLGDDRKYVYNKQVITEILPSDILDWVLSNTSFVMKKQQRIDKNKIPQYKTKKIISDFFAFLSLLCIILEIYCMVKAVQVPNETDKSKLAGGFLFGFIISLICIIVSLVIKKSLLERHLRKRTMELDTHILKDGRIAVIKYIYNRNWQPTYTLKRLHEKNEVSTTQESIVKYIYINIYNSINNIDQVADGVYVRWNGEKYFVWERPKSTKPGGGTSSAYYYKFYKFDVNDAEEIFPNFIEKIDYLKEVLMCLKKQ